MLWVMTRRPLLSNAFELTSNDTAVCIVPSRLCSTIAEASDNLDPSLSVPQDLLTRKMALLCGARMKAYVLVES